MCEEEEQDKQKRSVRCGAIDEEEVWGRKFIEAAIESDSDSVLSL